MLAITLGEAVMALGSQALFLGAAGWLTKALVTHRLAKDAEEFKLGLQSRADQFRIELQSSSDIEMERLRASLRQMTNEQQIRFAKLHERRADVIADVYNRLVHARSDAAAYILGDARNADLAAETNQKMLEPFRFIALNRIYLPDRVCELLDQFESTLRRSVINVDVFWARVNEYATLSPENRQMQNKVMLDACTFIESKSPAMLADLVREFRVLLGDRPQLASSTEPKN
jgi:hypothetical protein